MSLDAQNCVWCGFSRSSHLQDPANIAGSDTVAFGFKRALSDCQEYDSETFQDENISQDLQSRLDQENYDLEGRRPKENLGSHWDT